MAPSHASAISRIVLGRFDTSIHVYANPVSDIDETQTGTSCAGCGSFAAWTLVVERVNKPICERCGESFLRVLGGTGAYMAPGTMSNKGCREDYTDGECPCPAGRCWVNDNEDRFLRDLPALTPEAWVARLAPWWEREPAATVLARGTTAEELAEWGLGIRDIDDMLSAGGRYVVNIDADSIYFYRPDFSGVAAIVARLVAHLGHGAPAEQVADVTGESVGTTRRKLRTAVQNGLVLVDSRPPVQTYTATLPYPCSNCGNVSHARCCAQCGRVYDRDREFCSNVCEVTYTRTDRKNLSRDRSE